MLNMSIFAIFDSLLTHNLDKKITTYWTWKHINFLQKAWAAI